MGSIFIVGKLRKSDGSDWIRMSKSARAGLDAEIGNIVKLLTKKVSILCEVHSSLAGDSHDLCRISKKSRDTLGINVGEEVELHFESRGPQKKKKVIPKYSEPKKIKKGIPEICILTIDCSESMRGQKFQDAKDAVKAYLDTKGNILDGDIVGCAGFDGQAYEVFAPTSDYKKAKTQIDNLKLRLGTDIGVALNFALKMIEGTSKKGKGLLKKKYEDYAKHIILVADGNGNPNTPKPAAQLCKKSGIIVDVVGIVDYKGSLQEDLLRDIAKITKGKYYSVHVKGAGPQRLQHIFQRRSEKLDY